MPPKEVDKKRSIGTYEDKCLKLITRADKFAQDNVAGLTETGKKQAEGHIKAIEEQFDRMNKRWEDEFRAELETTDENLHDELAEKVDETSDKVDKAIQMLYSLIDKPLASASALDPRVLKPDKSWNPGILAASSNLEEYNAWEEIFMAQYFAHE